MAKKISNQIWRVNVNDAVYKGTHDTYLLRGNTAAEVERKALALSKSRNKELAKGETLHKPYIQSIDFLGELAD